MPKHKKVTTKICRKSFMSNCLHAGLSEREAYTMTGHKDKSMAKRYDQRQFSKLANRFVKHLKEMDQILKTGEKGPTIEIFSMGPRR